VFPGILDQVQEKQTTVERGFWHSLLSFINRQ
jgi:hypothetical protein